MRQNILLLEDDKELADLISRFLDQNGFEVLKLTSIREFKATSSTLHPALVICDIMLPDGDGFKLFPLLKKHFSCPIFFLTALDSDHSQIKGLNLGADDYLIKPIRPELLLARINSALRLKGVGSIVKVLGPLTLDTAQRRLYLNHLSLHLNDDETHLFELFFQAYPTPLSRENLFREIIGREYDGLDRAADLKVSRLRKKIRTHGLKGLDIISIRGEGYLIQIPTVPHA
ncbi:response regulator transcription factor [Pseudoalteromonas piscicida]|uniref:response regulator transcription factor n=1 Tax=Pseudoalteromonas piscicida TaxID=43662 RepID=UPI003C7AC670